MRSRQLITLLLAVCPLFAAETGHLSVRINDANPVDLSGADLAAMPRHTVALDSHGTVAKYEGVLISDILRKAGFDIGKGLHGKQFAAYVTAIGSDDYTVVFSLAEFDPSVVTADIIVADKQNGEALPDKEGPLRVVAPHDKRPARSVRMLKELDVVQLRK